jgi:DnaK suppressor protein
VDLTEAQRCELRADLENLVVELQALVAGSQDAARPVELDQPAMGRVSRIDAIQQQKMLEANRDAQRGRIQLVRSALHRFEEDEYGECMTCGECIGYARLKISPEAPFCIECQNAREKR